MSVSVRVRVRVSVSAQHFVEFSQRYLLYRDLWIGENNVACKKGGSGITLETEELNTEGKFTNLSNREVLEFQTGQSKKG